MAQPAASDDYKVLLVEDDSAVAEMCKLGLELNGYTVVVAPDGETGLYLAKQFRPDVIVLDIALPGMNGLALLDKMRAEPQLRAIPTLILTNHDDPDIHKRAVELGALKFLAKSKTTADSLAGWVRRPNG
ncbi:MAG TPA: response regulator [Candidatus Dormibacteraeota bacterium]|nr:response regulator [Candidatus Dormibacteraeota bacterium]